MFVLPSVISLEDIEEVEAPRSGALHVVVYSSTAASGSHRLVLYTPRARTLAAMIGQFAAAAQPQVTEMMSQYSHRTLKPR